MEEASHIRNFVIIAHIDHGKSTLADRFLELTQTVEARKMKPQMLDQMDLERERGITIKMQPVRMLYMLNPTYPASEAISYTLNLIDTPGHVDFSYEVSRALAAVEGAILLVDATKGIEAQTLSHFFEAKKLGLFIIPVINKIDLRHARIEETKKELEAIGGFKPNDIFLVSAKTGEGVEALLDVLVAKIPPPGGADLRRENVDLRRENADLRRENADLRGIVARALIFDSFYDNHRGVVAYVRVFDGGFKKGDELLLIEGNQDFEAKEVGIFAPALKVSDALSMGEIGYIITGVKSADAVRIGDTVTNKGHGLGFKVQALQGYREPKPVLWASFFPKDQGAFVSLRDALQKLRLNDASLSFIECFVEFLGRGYQCGFLGMLHLEIIRERLRREFNMSFIATRPSVGYRVHKAGESMTIFSPALFPRKGEADFVEEPMMSLEIIAPSSYSPSVFKMKEEFEIQFGDTELFGADRLRIRGTLPLRALVSGFFDALQTATSGYASLNYQHAGFQRTELKRIDVLACGKIITALSHVSSPNKVMIEARRIVEAVRVSLSRQLFEVKIQASVDGRIIASGKLAALKKDVTSHLYGGDRTRKMKLWSKQKRGKERLRESGSVDISPDTFMKILAR